MPSYIEFDKESSFPSSSNISKVIFGINSTGQAVVVDSSGNTLPLSQSSGGGTGLYIPKPIVYGTQQSLQNENHIFNENISSVGTGTGQPGSLISSWNNEKLKLCFDSTNIDFLNYNPKYFLFIYHSNYFFGSNNSGSRQNSGKFGKYFTHPASFSGSYIDSGMGGFTASFVNIGTYTNFSGNNNIDEIFGLDIYNPINKYSASFTDFTTEWQVATGSGQPTILNGFNPLRFYYVSSSFGLGKGREFLPMLISGSTNLDNGYFITTTTNKSKKYVNVRTSPVTTYVKPRTNLYIKFAIVVDDPNNTGRYLIGPMSDTVKIFLKEGYFYDDLITMQTHKYFYRWAWKFV